MNKFLKVVASILLVQSIFLPLTNDYTVRAQTGSTYVSLDAVVTNGLLDENNDSIYLVAPNRLYFIKASTMEVSKTISFDGNPTDLDLYNGKLYLPLENQILVVDSIKRTKVDTLPVSASRLAFDQNKMFYTTQSYYSELWVYNLTEKKNITTITSDRLYNKVFNSPDLTVDVNQHILYAGDSIGTNCLFAYSTTDYKKVSNPIEVMGDSISAEDNHLILDGKELFYNSKSVDPTNFKQINGHYDKGAILSIKGNNVYTKNGIYHREYFVKIANLPVNTTFALEDSNGRSYYFDPSTKRLKKEAITKLLPKTNYSLSNNQLTLKEGITDWAINDADGMIYAVSEKTNKLYWIRKSDLNIVKEIFVGSNPTDVELYNGKLYIPLHGSTKTVAVDAGKGEILNTYNLGSYRYSLQVDSKRIYYNEEDNITSVYCYNFTEKTNQKLMSENYSKTSLCLDRNKGVLYIGKGEGELYKVNTSDLTITPCIQREDFNDYTYSSLQRDLVRDGDHLYFAGYLFKTSQISIGKEIRYYNDDILFARGDKVFGEKASYDRLGRYRITPEFQGVDFAYMDEKDWVYFYRENTQSIYKNPFKKYRGGEEQPKAISAETLFKDFPLPAKMLAYVPTDIDKHWSEGYLRQFIFAGLLKGYVDEKGMYTIKPNNKITRAEFVTILVRALTLYSQDSAKSFVDVKKDDWYYDSVRIASSLKIVNGVDSTHFAPNNPIKRDEMAAIIIRAMGATLDKSGEPKDFSDIKGNWARNSILEASKAGIINGFEDGTFRPSQNATRAESVKMLYTAMKKQIGNLPTDENLKLYAITGETNPSRVYTTGFQYDYNNYIFGILNGSHDNGYNYYYDSWGPYDVEVLEKSNSLAVLRMKGGTYEISRHKYANGVILKEAYTVEKDVLIFIIMQNGYMNTYYSQPYSN